MCSCDWCVQIAKYYWNLCLHVETLGSLGQLNPWQAGDRALIVAAALGAKEEVWQLRILDVMSHQCLTFGWLGWHGSAHVGEDFGVFSHLDTCRFFWCRLDSNRSQSGFATNESQTRIAFVRFRLDSQVAEFFYFPWAPGESTRHVHEVLECCDVLCLSLTLRGFARTVGGCAFIMQLADQEEASLFC